MERDGLIKRIQRRETPTDSKPNEYSFKGLIKAAKPYAIEKIEERAEASAAKAAKAARKGKAKLKLVKDE